MADEDMDLDFDSPGTGSGGNDHAGFSETGPYSSGSVRASGDDGGFTNSFSNTRGGDGTTFMPDTPSAYDRGRTAGSNWNQANVPKFGLQEYNQIKGGILPAVSPSSPGGGGGTIGNVSNATGAGPSKVGQSGMTYDELRGFMTDSEVKNMLGVSEEKKSSGGGGSSGGGKSGGGGGGSLFPKSPTAGMYDVKPNPLPFQPIIPTPGSGMKKAFFDVQEDLLKAMAPYWLRQFETGGA